jgi:hypothetical protein
MHLKAQPRKDRQLGNSLFGGESMEAYTPPATGNNAPRYHEELCAQLYDFIAHQWLGKWMWEADFDHDETQVVLMGWIQGYGTVMCNGQEVTGLAFELASNPVMGLRIRLASRVIEQDYAGAYALLTA